MTAATTSIYCKRHGNPCCYNQHLILESKSCKECPYGSIGWNCNQTCPAGFYGRLCQSACECPARDCHRVTGCTTENSSYWSENTIYRGHQASTFTDWLVQTKDWQTRKIPSLKPSTVSEWSNKTTDMQTMITSSTYLAERHDEYNNVNQHDVTWLAVSCSLIGSLATLFLIGCFLYFRSRRKLKKNASKGIQRILFSPLEPDRNLQHHPQEGHLELSTLIPTQQCQDDDPYTEIRYSQIGSAYAETGMNKNEECNKKFKQPSHDTRNTNLFEKCSFETEYDHLNHKKNSSIPGMLLKEGRIVCSDLQEYADLSVEGRLQQKIPIYNGTCSSKSLTFPRNLKRVSENNQLKTHSYSLCLEVLENQLKVDQDKTDLEENCVVKNHPDNLLTASDPNVKEEARPYSFVHSLLNNDLSSEDVKTSTAVFSIIAPDGKEDLEKEDPRRLINRPYSYVKKS